MSALLPIVAREISTDYLHGVTRDDIGRVDGLRRNSHKVMQPNKRKPQVREAMKPTLTCGFMLWS